MKRILDKPPTISQELINSETNIPTITDMINERQIIYMMKSNRKEGIQNTTIKSDPWNARLQKEIEVPNKRGGNSEMSSSRYKTKGKAQNKRIF